MVRTRFAVILYFRMVAHKAACQTLPKAFLKSMKTWYRFCWCWRYFSHRILRFKICSMVLLPVLNLAYSSAIISSGWGLSLFKITFSMTLLGLNNIYFEKLSHTNLQTEQSGFGRKLQACKDHLPKKDHLLN